MKPFNQNAIVLYSGMLLSITAFSIDIILQALSAISDDLRSPYSAVQLLIPVFLFCAGLGQVVMGPASDRFGRRPLILVGLGVYGVGSIISFAASNVEILMLGRALQGFGASIGPVLGRAVIRDLFHGKALASNMALATMIFAFGPIVAPLLGIGIMQFGSWRTIFLATSVFGLVLMLLGALRLPETLPGDRRQRVTVYKLLSNFTDVWANRQSRFFLLMIGPIMTMMIMILISVPRVYKDAFGIEGAWFAILFAFHGTGIIIGQLINRKIIAGFGVSFAMRTGSIVVFGTTLLMLFLQQTGWMGPYVYSAALALFATGYLVVTSNATALALDPHGSIAGFVSSLLGAVSQVVSSAFGIVIGFWIGGDLMSFISALLVVTSFVMVVLFLYRDR